MSKASRATPFGPKAKADRQGPTKTGPAQKGGRGQFKGYKAKGLPHPLHDPDTPKGAGSSFSSVGGLDPADLLPEWPRTPGPPQGSLERKELRLPMILRVINDHDLFPQLQDWQTLHRPSYLCLEAMSGMDAALVLMERPQGLYLAPWEAFVSVSKNGCGFKAEGFVLWRAGDWNLWRSHKGFPATGHEPWEWPRLTFGQGRGMSWSFTLYYIRELQPFLHSLFGVWSDIRNLAENYIASAAVEEARYLQSFFKSRN